MATIRTEEQLVNVIVEAACHTVDRWRSGELLLDAHVLHHALRVLGEAGLPSDDEILQNLEAAASVAVDFTQELGLYCSGLASVGHLSQSLLEKTTARLDVSVPIVGENSRSPFERRTLERLLIIEAAILGDDASPEARLKYVGQIDGILQHDLHGSQAAGRTYPLYLRQKLDAQSSPVDLQTTFEEVNEALQARKLWYNDLRYDSLVLLNANQVSEFISPDLCQSLIERAMPLLAALRQERLDVSPSDLLKNPGYLVQLGPFCRLLIQTADAFKSAEPLLKSGSRAAREVASHRSQRERDQEAASESHLIDAMRKVLTGSMVVGMQLERLTGGYSTSAVYSAILNIEQPFRISGTRVVFKTDVSPRERDVRESLRQWNLHGLFARVLSEPAFIRLGDGSTTSVSIYEHLGSMRTLRSLLTLPRPEDSVGSVLTSCLRLLGPLWAELDDIEMVSTFSDVKRDILRASADVLLTNLPIVKPQLQQLATETQRVVSELGIDPAIVHSIAHKDLNCRNIMVDHSFDGDIVTRVKLIDYETVEIGQDPLIDLGELIEDAHNAVGHYSTSSFVEDKVLSSVPEYLVRRVSTADGRRRLLLARLRSICYLAKFGLEREPARRQSAMLVMDRWKKVLEDLKQVSTAGS